MRILLVASAIAASLAGSAAHALTEDYFLNVPGINGDITEKGYAGWISVTAFAAGISNDANGATNVCSEFKIVKPLDVTSPQFALAVASHQAFPTIQLLARTAGATQNQTLSFTLLKAYITSVKFGGDSDTSAFTEKLTIKPATVQILYRPQGPDGSFGAPVQSNIDCSSVTN